MSEPLPLPPEDGGGRFPGFDVMGQSRHWDDATTAVIVDRIHSLPAIRFFTPDEEACAKALTDLLTGQHPDSFVRIDVVRMIDQRLAEQQTDGWHYDTMPPDDEAWRQTLAYLDQDAMDLHGTVLAALPDESRHAFIEDLHTSSDPDWHGMPREKVWSLWTRYAATAFYSHPSAWNEMGFSGPAYPRGYKNPGLDSLEPYEVHDTNPSNDPLKKRS